MGIAIMEQSGHTAYGLKGYVLDSLADLDNLPVDGIPMGSWALIISDSTVYMLNSKGEWTEI